MRLQWRHQAQVRQQVQVHMSHGQGQQHSQRQMSHDQADTQKPGTGLEQLLSAVKGFGRLLRGDIKGL